MLISMSIDNLNLITKHKVNKKNDSTARSTHTINHKLQL